MRKSLTLALAATFVCSTALAGTASAAPEDGERAVPCVTLWQNDNFTGGWASFAATDADFGNNTWSNGQPMDDDAQSVRNDCSRPVRLFEGPSFAGVGLVVPANSSRNSLWSYGLADKVSSLAL